MCERCVQRAKEMEKGLNEILPKGIKVEVQIKSGGKKELVAVIAEKIERELQEDGYAIIPTGREEIMKPLAPELLIRFASKYEVYQDSDDDMIVISSEKGRTALLADMDEAAEKVAQQLGELRVLADNIRKMTKH